MAMESLFDIKRKELYNNSWKANFTLMEVYFEKSFGEDKKRKRYKTGRSSKCTRSFKANYWFARKWKI